MQASVSHIRAYLISPALPAAAHLLGMVFCLALAQFSGLHWQRSATITLYGVLFVWVALLAWRQRRLWIQFGMIDALFLAFILLVLASLAMQGISSPGAQKYGRYLPFMAIVPYVCGRLMRPRDVHLLSSIIAAAAPVMFMLLAIDYWQHAEAYHARSRIPFFGHYYAPLLIGALLAGSLIVFSFRSLTEGAADSSQPLLRREVSLVASGLVMMAMVWIVARGALLAGMLGTICVVLTVRHVSLSRRFVFLLYLAVIVSLTSFSLPKPQAHLYQAHLYTDVLTMPDSSDVGALQPATLASETISEPIKGKASCRPLEQGTNSVAIRWMLYQEAGEMFVQSPWWGVGAASFGRYSCTGVMGYPHSTILQAFAELGVIGGLVFVWLMFAAFIRFFQKAVKVNATHSAQAAQLALAWFMMYLVAYQISGNYFTAAGFYLLAGVAAGMQPNSAWNDGVGESNVE